MDGDGRVIAILVGRPKDIKDEEWKQMEKEAVELIEKEQKNFVFTKKQQQHRRGPYPTVSTGVSFGGGQQVWYIYNFALSCMAHIAYSFPEIWGILQKPMPLWASYCNVHSLLDLWVLQKVFGILLSLSKTDLISRLGAFCTWAPKLFRYYKDNLGKLFAHYPNLQPIVPGQVAPIWAAAALNNGPNTVTYEHLDLLNLAFGWCAIFALGPFDFTCGGHFILWDMKLAIQFPPGSIILMPSAILRHSNAALHPGDRRYSLTLFSAGGLFRWVANGFKKVGASQNKLKEEVEEDCSRFEMALNMFSTLEQLKTCNK
jgi:hypothetical protein